MITQVDVFGVQQDSLLSMELGSTTQPFQIKEILGLDPIKAAISSTPYGAIAGEAHTGTKIGTRNIIFVFGLNPDWDTLTIADLRKILYEFFIPSFPVTLQFISTHLPDVQISGIVEDAPVNMFTKDPEVRVSIICHRPDFVAVDPTVETGVVFATVTPPPTVDEQIEAALGEITYAGSVETGAVIQVESSVANVSYPDYLDIHFQHGNQDLATYGKLFSIEDIGTIDATHRFELSSVPGSKYVRNIDNADVITNLLSSVAAGYSWPVLKPGVNRFGIRGTEAGQTWELSYYARFGAL